MFYLGLRVENDLLLVCVTCIEGFVYVNSSTWRLRAGNGVYNGSRCFQGEPEVQ